MGKGVTVKHLREVAERCVAEEPSRLGNEGWWRKPLLVTARVDDRFEILPKIAFEQHWQPKDLLATAKSVIVFFIPFKRNWSRKTGRATGRAETGESLMSRPMISSAG